MTFEGHSTPLIDSLGAISYQLPIKIIQYFSSPWREWVWVCSVLLTRTWTSRPRTRRQNTFKDRFRLQDATEHKTKQKQLNGGTSSCNRHFIKQCQRLKAIKLTGVLTAFMP